MRVAAIDCGTNSIRLLIADVDDGKLVELDRRMVIVRLGEGVDATGTFSEAALARTFAACDEFAAVMSSYALDRVRFVATSASRDVSNRQEFFDGVQARLGVLPDVISGNEEAHLSFLGATSGLPEGVDSPYLVIDIGGGSTEFVLGGQKPQQAISVNIGCVRMTERHFENSDPATTAIDNATVDIDAAISLANESVALQSARTIIGLAGSVTTVAAMALGLDKYDRKIIHGSIISADAVHRVSERLLTMSREARAALPFMHPGRVDVIGAGSLVLDRILHHLHGPQLLVSENDILDGIALDLAQE